MHRQVPLILQPYPVYDTRCSSSAAVAALKYEGKKAVVVGAGPAGSTAAM